MYTGIVTRFYLWLKTEIRTKLKELPYIWLYNDSSTTQIVPFNYTWFPISIQ